MNDPIVSDSGSAALLGTAAAYTFLRHIGFILDELCDQGLHLWVDEECRWHWAWRGTNLTSTTGFWAMGEAVVDAVIGRFPHTFQKS